MTEIFDMIAGTDTGAIIAGAISVRKETTKNINLVKDTMDFFEKPIGIDGKNLY
jgi:predicted acylesterase/phospholipase RssA